MYSFWWYFKSEHIERKLGMGKLLKHNSHVILYLFEHSFSLSKLYFITLISRLNCFQSILKILFDFFFLSLQILAHLSFKLGLGKICWFNTPIAVISNVYLSIKLGLSKFLFFITFTVVFITFIIVFILWLISLLFSFFDKVIDSLSSFFFLFDSSLFNFLFLLGDSLFKLSLSFLSILFGLLDLLLSLNFSLIKVLFSLDLSILESLFSLSDFFRVFIYKGLEFILSILNLRFNLSFIQVLKHLVVSVVFCKVINFRVKFDGKGNAENGKTSDFHVPSIYVLYL